MNKMGSSKEFDQIFGTLFDLPRVKPITCGGSLIDFLIRLILLLINISKILFTDTAYFKIIGKLKF